MSKRLLYDFVCESCGTEVEKLVDVETREVPCHACYQGKAVRKVPAPSIDYRIGVHPDSKGARKWERMHEQAAKQAYSRDGDE
jgi:putative FmdB family regulatory protein